SLYLSDVRLVHVEVEFHLGQVFGEREQHGPVVGATDFSDPSLPALEVAASGARRRGARLHLLHAFDLDVFAEHRAPATAMPYLQGKSWIALEDLDELRTIATRRPRR